MASWRQVLTDALISGVRSALRTATSKPQQPGGPRTGPAGQVRRIGAVQDRAGRYPGDLVGGSVRIQYTPRDNGHADPGEVVWAWVPYEEDASQGKDRPALVLAEQDGYLIALMLTSRDRDQDAAREARAGRVWMDVGAGDWDRQRRPSEVRLDRVLRLRHQDVRREGGRLPKARFDEVADALRDLHGWP